MFDTVDQISNRAKGTKISTNAIFSLHRELRAD